MVPKAGLEPARAVTHYPLKIACLPDSTTSAHYAIPLGCSPAPSLSLPDLRLSKAAPGSSSPSPP